MQIPSIFAFSALSWRSGVVRTFGQLFLVRSLMGIAEGPAWPTITATIETSSAPERRGRNVGIVLGAAGFMTWLFVMNVFAPLYITEVSKNSATTAGFVIGASGLGSFVWGWIFPWVSDRIGRKPALLIMAALSAVVPLTYQAAFLASHPWLLAGAGFVANGGQGIAALIIVLVPSESVPMGFAATAIGLATLFGEIVGGAFAPAIAGAIATRHGLDAPLWIAAGGAMVVFFASLLLRETASAKAARPVAA